MFSDGDNLLKSSLAPTRLLQDSQCFKSRKKSPSFATKTPGCLGKLLSFSERRMIESELRLLNHHDGLYRQTELPLEIRKKSLKLGKVDGPFPVKNIFCKVTRSCNFTFAQLVAVAYHLNFIHLSLCLPPLKVERLFRHALTWQRHALGMHMTR